MTRSHKGPPDTDPLYLETFITARRAARCTSLSPVDVPLGGDDRPVTGKQLDVSQRTVGLTITSTHGEHHRARRALIRIAELGLLLPPLA